MRAAVVPTGLLVVALAGFGLAGCSAGDAPDQGNPTAAAADQDEPTNTAADQGEPAEQETALAPVEQIPTYGVLGDFSAQTLERADFTPADIASKDVTVINFWSTTCPPCISEMPELAELAERLPDNAQIITLCFDGMANIERAQDILARAGFDGATLMWCNEGFAELANQVRYTPTTVFVAADGTVVGDVLVGRPTDLEQAYLDGINKALTWQGKPTTTLRDAE